MSTKVYTCDICHDTIPVDKYRYNCIRCEDYDCCENCHIQHTHPMTRYHPANINWNDHDNWDPDWMNCPICGEEFSSGSLNTGDGKICDCPNGHKSWKIVRGKHVQL
jgi:hypothetical protein